VLVSLCDRRITSGIGVDARWSNAQAGCDLSDNGLRDIALNGQQVFCFSLVLFRPEVALTLGFYQLHGEPDAAAGRADTPLSR
jgi:hypothetical protein